MSHSLIGRLSLACLGFGLLAGAHAQVTTSSMLREMVDLDRLTRRPNPDYKMAQASSYDRRSLAPDKNWFANQDAGNFLGLEERYHRKEFVMADLKGPGAVVRIWSANPSGIIRFYFDGEEIPRIQGDFEKILDGYFEPFDSPFAYEAGNGHDLYFPIPYAKSLKITIDDSQQPPTNLYYHVGYRTFVPGTQVSSFRRVDVTSDELDKVALGLMNPGVQPAPSGSETQSKTLMVSKDSPGEWDIDGAKAVYTLEAKVDMPALDPTVAWEDPRQAHNILRSLLLEASFDGEPCITTPLGDFFGTAPGINPYEGLPFSVTADGTMICRFVMPFRKEAKFVIRNVSDIPLSVTLSSKTEPYRFSDSSYLFHAQWTAERKDPRPMRDITLLNAAGEGMWVGDNLHVANPATEWWGEGDEKAIVDGENFPSTFGTGSEDYFGYAWSSTKLFARPYHGQPNAGSQESNFGHTDVHRWQVFDPIPYRKSLQFSIEAWSWNKTVQPTFAHTSYWYARPGGTPPEAMDTSLLLPPYLVPPPPPEPAKP